MESNRVIGSRLEPRPEPLTERYWQWVSYCGLPLEERWQRPIDANLLRRHFLFQSEPGDPRSSGDYYDRTYCLSYTYWGNHVFEDSLLNWPRPSRCLWCGKDQYEVIKKGRTQKKPVLAFLPHGCISKCPTCAARTPRLVKPLTVEEMAKMMLEGVHWPRRLQYCAGCDEPHKKIVFPASRM